MADGSRMASRRRFNGPAQQDSDPRYSAGDPDQPFGASAMEGKRRPRIAFTGEEFGFGYQATASFIERARRQGTVSDGGVRGVFARTEREYDEASRNSKFDYSAEISQPLRTKEQALMAVKQGTADFALIPFYHPYSGYDFESLRALSSLFTLLGVEQVEATDNLCLAVHESQLYDLIQSSHPGSGFSALQRRLRKTWGAVDNGSGNSPGFDAEMPRAGLPIDMSDQKLIRDRIDLVFAGPEAARRCKSKLDGLRSIGVDVQELPQMVEPHRELARRARSTVNTSRQTNTFYDPVSGETRFFSSLGAESQQAPLYGMVLPYEVAMRSSDYVIVDHYFDDAPPAKSRFLVVENNPDHTLFEDAYRTTDAKTLYWMKRLRAIADGRSIDRTGMRRFTGGVLAVVGAGLAAAGLAGVLGWQGLAPLITASSEMVAGADWTAFVFGLALMAVGGILSTLDAGVSRGVRVMLRFRRDQSAASIGDVENFLRNYGVRHAVARLDEDSEASGPSSIMLDVEFAPEDFAFNPLTMVTRRLRGSVANGAIKKAFQRWKNRGVLVLAAVPIETTSNGVTLFQLPQHQKRRWWNEAVVQWAADFGETMFIRLSRLLVYLLPVALAAYVVWTMIGDGK